MRRFARPFAALLVVVLTGIGIAGLAGGPTKPPAVDTRHGRVVFADGELGRILNAFEETTSTASQDELAAKGRGLFRSNALAAEGESCQTCHIEAAVNPGLATIPHEQEAGPNSPTNFDGPRDAPALWGLEDTGPYFWNGDVPTLQAAMVRPVKGHFERFVNGDCSGDAANNDECTTAAGQFAASLAAYMKTLDPPVTVFDQGRLGTNVLRGEAVFQGKGGCIACHGGPLFTDNLIHNTGVKQVQFETEAGVLKTSNDLGAGAPPPPAECQVAAPPLGCAAVPPFPNSAFINTPMLRDLKATAPYMHNGSEATLDDVVRFYDTESSVAPLNLTAAEISDLVAYLESL